ncbi:MAG TPA: hypothetical protein VJ044_18165, partial [Candidatus Hodarchaeales archaeon]|nr:hypothetical protein [Candidatus Hodarchaeales archaeon]
MSALEVKIASTKEDFINYSNEIMAKNPPILGFDTETALSHQNIVVSLIQLYDGQTSYLFRLSHVPDLPAIFVKLMGRAFIKVGFDVEMDAHKLRTYNQLSVQGLIDLQNILRSLNYPFTSMKDTVEHFFSGYVMDKGVNHQSWNDDILSEVAIQYAAYDVYLSYECYVRIMQMDRPQFVVSGEDDFLENRRDLLQVLRKTQTVKSLKLKSAQNFLVNSYAPWRNRYPEATRRAYIQATLEKLHQEQAVIIDYDTLYLYPEDLPGKTLTVPAFP